VLMLVPEMVITPEKSELGPKRRSGMSGRPCRKHANGKRCQ
jgi:hypothetical protein